MEALNRAPPDRLLSDISGVFAQLLAKQSGRPQQSAPPMPFFWNLGGPALPAAVPEDPHQVKLTNWFPKKKPRTGDDQANADATATPITSTAAAATAVNSNDQGGTLAVDAQAATTEEKAPTTPRREHCGLDAASAPRRRRSRSPLFRSPVSPATAERSTLNSPLLSPGASPAREASNLLLQGSPQRFLDELAAQGAKCRDRAAELTKAVPSTTTLPATPAPPVGEEATRG